MGERGMQIKADDVKTQWETNADLPVLCESCLGDNPYVRMMKEPHGQACKTCDRPFTSFRWKPGKRGKYKKTQVCRSCAKTKNVCQSCVLDLRYHLPTQVRDAFLTEEERNQVSVATSHANREWQNHLQAQALEQDEAKKAQLLLTEHGAHAADALGRTETDGDDPLVRLARSTPYYDHHKAHVCSFYAKGACNRGKECPYLHEMPGRRKRVEKRDHRAPRHHPYGNGRRNHEQRQGNGRGSRSGQGGTQDRGSREGKAHAQGSVKRTATNIGANDPAAAALLAKFKAKSKKMQAQTE